MTLKTPKRVRALVDDGATIVGTRPEGSPSLADDPAQWAAVAGSLWGGASIGKGRVFATFDEARAALNLAPDWLLTQGGAPNALAVRHRVGDGADFWFVSNRQAQPFRGTLSLRVTGKRPQLWDAATGRRRPASYRMEQGRTLIPLDLSPSGSTFLICRSNTAATRFSAREPRPATGAAGRRLDAVSR